MYNDKQLMAFSELAYEDLDVQVYAYKQKHPGVVSVPLSELSIDKDRYERIIAWVGKEEYESWSIPANEYAVYNDEGAGKSGFYACIIETSSGEPKDAVLAFRGSQSMFDLENLQNDWLGADLGLTNSEMTAQEKEAVKFLQKNENLIKSYGNVATCGHSLGGALSDFSAVAMVNMGMDSNLVQCANLDGPGHSLKFKDQNEDAIEKLKDKSTHYYWSRVGSQFWNISGKEKYIETTSGTHLMIPEHDRIYQVYEGDYFKESKAYEEYCKNTDLGRRSRLMDGFYYNTSFLPTWVSTWLLQGTIIIGGALEAHFNFVKTGISFAGDILQGAANVVGDTARAIWNFFTGGSDEEEAETPEQTAARLAANEAAENVSFTINPVSFINLSDAAEEISLNVMFTGTSLDAVKNGKNTDGIDIESVKSTVLNPYGSSALAQYNNRIKEIYEKIKALQEAATQCRSVIDPIQDTMGGCIDYLYLTGTEFIEVENEAKARVANWY